MLKKIFDAVSIFWCFGGGFFISILCLIWSWKLSLAILCLWGCSWIIVGMVCLSDKTHIKSKKKYENRIRNR